METVLDALSQLSPDSLLADPPKVESPIYLVLLAVFALIFVAGVTATLFAGRLSGGNRLRRRLLERYGAWAGWIGALGILAIGLRYARVPLLSKRLWTFLDSLALAALIVHFIWYRFWRYPTELAAYQDAERRRRFAPGRRPSPATRRSRRR